jgi:transposase
MSLPQFDVQGSLFESLGSIAPQLFGDQDRYQLFAQKVWPVLARCREQLAECYASDNGRPGIEPVVLLGVLIFQFLERVPDRQAVEMVKYHLGWKLALNLKLGDPGFHPTTLVYFRQRLLEYAESDLAFRAVLEALQAEGLLPKRGKQRLDSTHVLAAVADLSARECVRETQRLALEELGQALPQKARRDFWPLLWERYVENKLDYRSSPEVLRSKQVQAGEDCLLLLQWLEATGSDLRYGRHVELLREVFDQQFELKANQPEPVKEQAAGVVQSPHDPDAQWSAKGRGKHRKSWVGYKVQVAETLPEESQPAFLVSVVTQKATASDEPGLDQTLEAQAQSGLERPSELYADGAYISAPRLHKAAQEGWTLMGPAPASPRRPGVERLPVEEFTVDIAHQRAHCLAGHESRRCSRICENTKAKISYRFKWRKSDCQSCPLRAQCVPAGEQYRTLIVGEHHELLQQRRIEQRTEAFELQMHQRNAIEGTLSELARGHGLRRSRYRGFAKVELQNLLIGTACNIKRWLRAVLREVKEVQTRGFGLNLGFQHVRPIISDALSHIFDQSLSRNFSWRSLPLSIVSH